MSRLSLAYKLSQKKPRTPKDRPGLSREPRVRHVAKADFHRFETAGRTEEGEPENRFSGLRKTLAILCHSLNLRRVIGSTPRQERSVDVPLGRCSIKTLLLELQVEPS